MSYKTKILLIGLGCWLTVNVSFAQTVDADSMFIRARDQALAGNYDAARRTSRELLSLYPNYYDARVLIGKIYVWENNPDLARRELIPLLSVKPDDYELLTLLTDNAIEDKKYDEAISYADRALGYYPNDTEILFRKANSLFLKGDKAASLEIIDRILAVQPNNEKTNGLKNRISETTTGQLYQQAVDEARNGNHNKARETLNKVLAENPNHTDASMLMAYTYGWDGRYNSARTIIQELAGRLPIDDYELFNLTTKIETWDKEYITALSVCNKALDVYTDDQNFLYQKAWIEYLLQDYKDALKQLEHLLTINPQHEEGNELYKLVMNSKNQDYVFLENYFEFVDKPNVNHKLVQSLGLAKWTKYGTFLAKVNVGYNLSDFSSGQAFQYELEAYPKLNVSNYLYLDYAFSLNEFFPNHRSAFELFHHFSKGFGASLGVRTMYWTSMKLIYTGSVSWLGNRHYVAFRPFFHHTDNNWIDSYTLMYRYYFTPDKDDYFYAVAGAGSYSDEFLQLNPYPGNSYMAQLGMLKFIHPRWNLQVSAGYNYDDGYRDRWQCMAGLRYYFNMSVR